jgi:predicted Rossmann fold nucleotide-binding protein DprA/Smf involved in DNA uptake
MKDAQKKLLAISRTLTSLVKQVEKMAAALEKESGKAAPAKKAKAAVKKAKANVKKAKATPKKKIAKKAAPKAAKAKPAAGGDTMLDNIYGMISRSRKGITVERIKKRTGLQPRQVSNALYKLTKKGQIETLSRGVYVKKKK